MARASYEVRTEVEVELTVLDFKSDDGKRFHMDLSYNEAKSLFWALRDALRQAGEDV